VGKKQQDVSNYRNAGEVLKATDQSVGLHVFLGRAQHLSAIHKLPREAWREHERRAAKERQAATLKQNADRGGNVAPTDTGKARDKIGQRVGVSGKSIDKAGEMLAEMDKNKGAAIPTRSHDVTTLADLGITKLQSRWRSVANEAPPPIDQDYARATVCSCGIDRCD
jgi:hypothetical protein